MVAGRRRDRRGLGVGGSAEEMRGLGCGLLPRRRSGAQCSGVNAAGLYIEP